MNPVCLNEVTRRARKPHRCNLCGEEIKKGTEYDLQTIVCDGMFYGWKMHPECNAVSSFLWDYVDPDEGMSEDEFLDACSEVCRTFSCPDCKHFDAEGASDGDYCKENRSFCIHKLYELAQKYYLSRQRRTERGWIEWRLVPIEKAGNKA